MIVRAADLRDVEAIALGPDEVVYAFLSVESEPSAFDEAVLDDVEIVRSARFVRAADSHRFVLAGRTGDPPVRARVTSSALPTRPSRQDVRSVVTGGVGRPADYGGEADL